MEEAHWEKPRSKTVAATIKEANTWLLFTSCGCTQEVKLNIKWQIVGYLKKVNMNFTDRIASLATLHYVENFELCNKHQFLLIKHLGFVTKSVPKNDFASQIDVIWQLLNLLDFTLLVREMPE